MMQCFDVSLDYPSRKARTALKVVLVVQKKNYPAEIRDYPPGEELSGKRFARACAALPFFLKWKDPVEVWTEDRELLGKGFVLDPVSEDPKKMKSAKRLPLLELLSGDVPDMLLAFAEEKGFQGVREREILERTRLDASGLETAARKLEEGGKARILSFSPLHVVSQGCLEYLCRRIDEFITQFHEKHPEARGVASEKIIERFDLGETVFQLALKLLLKSGRIQILDDIVALATFKVPLTSQEEGILQEMEQMCFDGKFSTVTLEDVRQRFQISMQRLQTLLSLLAERKKIVQGKEGFYIHSRWLDEMIRLVRHSGKRELSVADFKAITGLTRKYAIPLLELLDEMGVTRRRGPGREIL
jgi:selenocysteine-specific elongation factor